MNNLRVNESMYLSDLVILKCIKERLKELSFDEDFLGMKKYIQHGTTDCVLHSIAVTHYSLIFALRLHIKVDYKKLVCGALLHDYFLYDWHENDRSHRLHGYHHADTSCTNAINYFQIGELVQQMIRTHMWPLTITKLPRSREAWILCLVDKYISTKETFAMRKRG